MEGYEFDEATLAKVKEFETSLENTQADIIKYSIKKQLPVFEQRDVFLKNVDKFWFKALQNCITVGMYIDDEDRDALQHLTTVRVERNLEDPREATIHFDFEDNEFFSNKTLTKAFKVREGADPLGSDDFEFADSVKTEKIKIDWKSDEKNLSKKSPAVQPNGDDEDDQLDPGSFFSSFFEDDQTFSVSIGDTLINEFYPRAIDYYLGAIDDEYDMYESGDEEEYDDEDDEDDEEDEEDGDREIDLEEEEARETKKAKK